MEKEIVMTKTGYARFVLTLLFAALSFHDPLRAAESTETLASSPDSDWPMFKHDLKRTGFSPSTAPNSPALVWKTDIGRWGKFWSSACVADGKLYIGGNDGNLYCLDAEEGNPVWTYRSSARRRFAQPRGILSSPALADGKVFVTVEGDLLALPETDPNGDGAISPNEVLWSYEIGGDGVCSPVVANGFVYVGNHRGTVYCFGPKH